MNHVQQDIIQDIKDVSNSTKICGIRSKKVHPECYTLEFTGENIITTQSFLWRIPSDDYEHLIDRTLLTVIIDKKAFII